MWCRIGLWIARGEFSDPCLGSDPPCGMQSHPYSGWLKLTNKSGVFFASGPERHLGWGGVSDPLFTTLLSLQWSNAIQQKHPRALSSRPRGFFSPWKINLILKQPLCLHLACEIFVNFINTADKLRDAQISAEINQVLQFWEEKVALFSDLYRKQRLQSVIMTENMSQQSVFIL